MRVAAFIAVLSLAALFPVVAQQPEGVENPSPKAPVVFEGETLFIVHTPIGGVPVDERALAITRRIYSVGKDKSRPVDSIRTMEVPGVGTLIISGDTTIFTVNEEESAAAGLAREKLAEVVANDIRRAVTRYRNQWTLRNLLIDALYTLGAIVVFILLLRLLAMAHGFGRKKILSTTIESKRLKRFSDSGILSPRRVAIAGLAVLGVLRWAAVIVLIQAFLTVVLSFFPGTSGLAASFSSWILTPLAVLWAQFVLYLPSLFFVIVIFIATFYILKLNKFLFMEIREGKIKIDGFYPDWAEPTSKLVGILIFTLAVVVVFPYLPGSSSPAFKGISLLFGVLLSFGSGSATANIISGTILTYMRPFQLGDHVKIADTVGDIVEKSLFVTRIKTIKNAVTTIPNSSVLGSHILNYSTRAKESGLIVHTSVTIGYGVPWRQVHGLLIDAALATPAILTKPSPFVLQTALQDFYIAYEINAYTAHASGMAVILSNMHQNIQDKFNEAGVEIMSPHNYTMRDGQAIAIPESYYPAGYQPPPFKVKLEEEGGK